MSGRDYKKTAYKNRESAAEYTIASTVPPHNIEIEHAVLGAILVRAEALHDVIDILRADSFYSPQHQIIYEAILTLQTKLTPIDVLTLSTYLEEHGKLEKIGGKSYIANLSSLVPSSANARSYAEQVQKYAVMRKLISASENIRSLSYDMRRDLHELLGDAEKTIFEVTNIPSAQKIISLDSGQMEEAWKRIEKVHEEGEQLRGISTGFKGLDNMLSGFQPSDLIILAARPSMGKTSLALDFARKVAIDQNIGVAIFSLEMSAQQLIDRMLAAQSQVDGWKLRTGKVTNNDDFDSIRVALEQMAKAPIYIDDEAGKDLLSMRSVARRLKSEKDIGLIIVDYLQLASPSKTSGSDSMVQQVTELSRGMKSMAREVNVPVVCLSQLSRGVEQRGGKPRLSDLRDSGSIEQDADLVMFIHNESKFKEDAEKTNICEILIEKHRNGPTGSVELYFDNAKTSFRDIDSHHSGGGGGDGFDAF